MNEFGEVIVTTESNIGDYIWYIIGGAALFFVLVGFIADKTGLIKKTFNKESIKDKIVPTGDTAVASPTIPVVMQPTEENQTNEESLIQSNEEIPVQITDEVSEPIVEEEQTPVALDTIVNNENQEEIVTFDDSIGNNDDFMLDGDNNISDDILMGSLDEIQIEETADSTVAPDEQENSSTADEDVWGIEEEPEEKNSEEVSLPAIEDVNEAEEDVWKF